MAEVTRGPLRCRKDKLIQEVKYLPTLPGMIKVDEEKQNSAEILHISCTGTLGNAAPGTLGKYKSGSG